MRDYGVLFQGLSYAEGLSFSLLTTFGTGGRVAFAVYPRTVSELIRAVCVASKTRVPFIVLGGGSNVIASDKGYGGTVISTARMRGISGAGETFTAKAGTKLKDVYDYARERNIGGFEFMRFIPGSAGASVVGNAGCFGRDMACVTERIRALDLKKLAEFFGYDDFCAVDGFSGNEPFSDKRKKAEVQRKENETQRKKTEFSGNEKSLLQRKEEENSVKRPLGDISDERNADERSYRSACRIPNENSAEITLKSRLGFGERSEKEKTKGRFADRKADGFIRTEELREAVKASEVCFSREEAKFGYRTSALSGGRYLVTGVEFRGKGKFDEELAVALNRIKVSSQPMGCRSAGSVFLRSGEFYPAKAIDEMGLKGLSLGGATVHSRHAGFIVNEGNATSEDVLGLIGILREKLFLHCGEKVRTEIVYIGDGAYRLNERTER